MKTENLFVSSNIVEGVTADDYIRVSNRLDSVIAMARLSNQKMYVIDYFKKSFLYVSEGFADFCGLTREELKDMGFELYLRKVPESDFDMLAEINREQFKLLDTFSKDEMKKYIFSCDFQFESHGYLLGVHHQLTPLAMKNGRVWLALCSVSLSSSERSGNVVIRKEGSDCYYEFVFDNISWRKKYLVPMNDMERSVIALSACGLSVDEISERLCKSPNTIKSCKQNLFRKLGVKNISGAVSYVMNHHLW